MLRAKTRKRTKRPFEPSVEDLKNFVGTDSLLFENMLTRLAESYAVDGPEEEDCIREIAKNLVLKRRLPTQRCQIKEKVEEEIDALDAFGGLLSSGAKESKIVQALKKLPERLGAQLRKVRREAHDSTEAWTKALKKAIFDVLEPDTIFSVHKAEQALRAKLPSLTDEILARELYYEKCLDDAMDRARKRLLEIKAAKRAITFRDFRRFDRAYSDRIVGVLVE